MICTLLSLLHSLCLLISTVDDSEPTEESEASISVFKRVKSGYSTPKKNRKDFDEDDDDRLA